MDMGGRGHGCKKTEPGGWGPLTTVESQARSSLNLLTMASLIFNNPHHLRLFLSCERFRLSSDFFSLQNLLDSMSIDFNHDLKT